MSHPVVTPGCYGAWAFFAARLWSVAILRAGSEAAPKGRRGLQRLLAAGSLFAWGNFGYPGYRFPLARPGGFAFGCAAAEAALNPLGTPCFYGAILFLSALVISGLIRRARFWGPDAGRTPRA